MHENLTRWLSIAANLGIIVGLVLVYFQMGQDEKLAKLELSTRAIEQNMAQHLQMMGEDASEAMAQAHTNPEELSPNQIIQLNSYLTYHVVLLDYWNYLESSKMSAAPPGAGGHYHVNCQPAEYWIERMQYLGYYYKETVMSGVIFYFLETLFK